MWAEKSVTDHAAYGGERKGCVKGYLGNPYPDGLAAQKHVWRRQQ